MPMNRLAFALLAVTCVAAAGGGAYLATRQNQTAVPVAPVSVQTQPTTLGTPATVTETESIVDEVPKVEAAVKPAATAPRVARRPAPKRSAQRSPAAERSTA